MRTKFRNTTNFTDTELALSENQMTRDIAFWWKGRVPDRPRKGIRYIDADLVTVIKTVIVEQEVK